MSKLTAQSITKLKATESRREIPDSGCPGLYLVIQPSGRKSWALRFRQPNGRPVKLTLGSVDLSLAENDNPPVLGGSLSLAAAHLLAADLKQQRARGHDVAAVARRSKLEKQAGVTKTFGDAVVDFVQQHAMPNTRRWKAQARLLGLRAADGLEVIPGGLADRWRDKPLSEITDDDIHALVDEVREKGVPGLARKSRRATEGMALSMFSTLSTFFKWLLHKRRLKQNPCVALPRPKTPASRDRVLTATEIVAFWSAANELGDPYAPMLKLLLLTGCRLNEVARMRRAELSTDGEIWTIPGNRTKNKRTHVVPLAPRARELIATLPSEREIVFTTDGRAPVASADRIKKRLDTLMDIPKWRLHDLRRTCATGMAEIGVAPHIVEACLNHVSGAKAGVAGIYNRAVYGAEKKAALELWAAHVKQLTTSI
jgi:integrase